MNWRVFRDRFINDKIDLGLMNCVKIYCCNTFIEVEVNEFENLLFGDYLDPDRIKYEEVIEMFSCCTE